MKIFEITSKSALNDFIASRVNSQFLQSWEWGEFQESMGSKVFKVGIEQEGILAAAATLIKRDLPIGRSYFYCPRGPIMNFEFRISNFESISNDKIFDLLVDEIYLIAKKENVIFFRFEPTFKIQSTSWRTKFKIIKTLDIQPSKTIILDLTKSEEELLKNMHQKTRYNIRLAEKKGVKIREGNTVDFEEFWKIMSETRERDGFKLHSKDYYGKMLNFGLNKDSEAKFPVGSLASGLDIDSRIDSNSLTIRLFLAEYDGRIIACNIAGFFGDTVTYMHGASSNEYRNIMAPYLLQWEAIKLAKKMGYKYYDFYGIDGNKWPGVTRFKKGFGGQEIEYPGTFDVVFNGRWYNVYRFIRYFRRLY